MGQDFGVQSVCHHENMEELFVTQRTAESEQILALHLSEGQV